MPAILLSVIVIGRNEASGLPALFRSLLPLRQAFGTEAIYVDSASSDCSATIAKELFDHTIELASNKNLNASAGRYVGTLFAKGRWLLFLDGDMELVSNIVPELIQHVSNPSETRGATGRYVHEYQDGSRYVWKPRVSGSGVVAHFGGAVLLPARVLALENWDPRLFSNEEIDLYARLRSHGVAVRSFTTDFVRHKTETHSWFSILKSNYIAKGSFLGKKFGGIGQVLHARIDDGRILDLIRWLPEPFVLWVGTLLAIMLSVTASWIYSFVAIAVAIAFVSVRKPLKYVLLYYAFLFQAAHGWRLLDKDWRPIVTSVFAKTAA